MSPVPTRHSTRFSRVCRWPTIVVALILVVAVIATTSDTSAKLLPETYAQVSPTTPQTAPESRASQSSPLDQPLNWLYEAKRTHDALRDYSCLLIQQERINGTLQPASTIVFKYRARPFSVNMRWLGPQKLKGQEVSFVYGKNRNKMRVKSVGVLKRRFFVSIDPNDSRVKKFTRHSIYEAGIGTIINRTIRDWQYERKLGKTDVKVAQYNFNKRPCIRIETTRKVRYKNMYAYRSVLYLDKETKLPVRNENYSWPRQGGPAGGDLMEIFSFINFQYNSGLGDDDFDR